MSGLASLSTSLNLTTDTLVVDDVDDGTSLSKKMTISTFFLMVMQINLEDLKEKSLCINNLEIIS